METIKIGNETYERIKRSEQLYRSGKYMPICQECAEANGCDCILIKNNIAHSIKVCNEYFGKDGYPKQL